MKEYNHTSVEAKWQKFWVENKTFAAEDFSKKEKWFTLVEFPYPSGAGLHVGHVRSYAALDTLSRKKRMEGYNVLYPIGWDAFGLPTENYAIKNKIHPRVATDANIKTFRRQLQALGLSYDWDREVDTTDPEYYKWTQWIFLKLLEKGLAYKKKMPINWCLSCKIGLANEEVVNGVCERCGGAVEKRDKEQWMLAITKYADRLIDDLATVDFLEKIKAQQINWIGRKQWIDITYPIDGTGETVVVSTTRPDTNFGATFVVLAPEHPLLSSELIPLSHRKEVEKYIKQSQKKSDLDRVSEGRKKTGVFTGLYCVNQLNNKRMPLWVGDFVLGTVGTGAVVGVPGHDLRDFEFAQACDIPIIRVVVGKDGDRSPITRAEQVQEDEGTMINSEFLNGMEIKEAISAVMDYLEKKGWGKRTMRYNLRDWVFSRQRYWGEPIPVVHCAKCGTVPLPETELPLKLPDTAEYEPTDNGESPLARMESWVNTKCPKCQGAAKRETDTMPNWAGSSWYFLRYTDAHNDKAFADLKKLKYWTPVNLYNGGMEHTTLHLLYSRFWHKFLYDCGYVPTAEPYAKRISHGMILAEDGKKMSKSLGNVINPDDIIKKYGADVLRVYEMFMGPFDQAISWDSGALAGVKRFLDKIWKTFSSRKIVDECPSDDFRRVLNQTIKKVGEDIDNFKFNTAVAQLMILMNAVEDGKEFSGKSLRKICLILAPFAPHLAEEIWHEVLGGKDTLSYEKWPEYDLKFLETTTVHYAVQVNGKLRGDFEISKEATKEEAIAAAKTIEKVAKYLSEGKIIKEIVVLGKIVGFVVK
ncbi:leucine--tRNA ligase [Candidatus Gracilibacteria bacterium]|nr:leucine--tRNA ligase [Candidatus Gracilibacteria bacterium]